METPKQPVFYRHKMENSNNRAVRNGNDPEFITGYHQLWHGYALSGDKNNHETDIAVSPIDAPDFIPAGSCLGKYLESGRRCVTQSSIWRD